MTDLHDPTPIRIPELQAGKPEISMAPLIDVVFLLLIFFVATTIFPDERGLLIERPSSTTAESLSGKQLRFVIDAGGRVFYHNSRIDPGQITRQVREQLSGRPDVTILLEVDRRTATAALIKVMDACRQGGAVQVGIVTEMADNP